jgi:hypothetical protein
MAFDAPSTDLNDVQQAQQPVLPAPNNAASAAVAPILQGAPDLAAAVAQAFLKHTTQIASNSTVAQKAQAAEKQKAQAAATPAEDRPVPQPSGSGSFADKLSGALGDAAHASDTKGGWLSGVANTLNARNQRLAQAKKDDVLLARSQAENIAMHRNFYQQDLEHRQQFHESNQKFFDAYKESNDQETMSQAELADHMKNDKSFAQEHLVRATGEVPVTDVSGNEVMEKDSGRPVMTPTYTVMKIATKDGSPATGTVDQTASADFKKYLGLNYPVGTKLTILQDNALNQKMVAARSAASILSNTNGKELSQEQIDTIRPLLSDPTVTSAISEVPGSAYAGIVRHMKNADDHLSVYQAQAAQAKASNNQQALDAANANIAAVQEERQKLATVDSQAITQKQRDEFHKDQKEANGNVAEYLSDPSKIQGHAESVIAAADDIIGTSKDPAVVKQAQRARDMATNVQKLEDQRKVDLAVSEQNAKTKAAQIDNNPNGLSGEAFLKTLPPGRANLVKALAEGRLPVNANAFERSTAGKPNQLGDDVFAAYPDFNAEKGANWPKAVQEFTISGADHKKAQAYNVALAHMKSLYDNTTAEGVMNPMSKAFQDRQLDITQVTREFGNAVAAGVLTQSEAEEVKNALTGTTFNALTPALKRERIVEAASLLARKIDEVQREFNDRAPSASIKVPTLLGPEAKRSLDYVQSGGGKQQPGQPAKIGFSRPADVPNATGAAPDPKTNKMYWHDAAGKVIREVKAGELPNE